MLKQLLLFLGSIIIGFGIGLISGSYFNLSLTSFWLLIIGNLVGGGFLLALSLRRSTKPKKIEEKVEEKKKEVKTPTSPSQDVQNN